MLSAFRHNRFVVQLPFWGFIMIIVSNYHPFTSENTYITHLARNTSHRILLYNYSHNSEGCHHVDSGLCCKLAFRVNDKDRSRHRTLRAFAAVYVPVYRLYRTDVSKNSNLSSYWRHSLQRCRAGGPYVAVVFSRYLPPLIEAGGRLSS